MFVLKIFVDDDRSSAVLYQTSYLDKVDRSFKFFIWKVLSSYIAVYTGGERPFTSSPWVYVFGYT